VCRKYWRENPRGVFLGGISSEEIDGRRIVAGSDSAISFVPFFFCFSYKTYLAAKQSAQKIAQISQIEIADLATVLKDVLVRFDNLWRLSFPYVLVLHQAPTDGTVAEGFHFHIEFHPPLRSPNLLKHLAGPELGGGSFLSDTSPEQKAEEL